MKSQYKIQKDWKHLLKITLKAILFILITYQIWSLGTTKRKTVWVFQKDYWKVKLLDFVDVGDMIQVPFNSTLFALSYAKELGMSMNPIRYISMSGSMVTLPNNNHGYAYIHIYRVLELPCDDPVKRDGTYNGYCFQKPVRSLVFAQLLDIKFNSVKGEYKSILYPTVYDIYTPDVDLYPGPEDARAILDPWHNVILSFNMAEKDKNEHRSQWVFNTTSGITKINRINLGDKQKNWTPFFRGDKLLHVYSWNPIKVVDCSIKHQDCIFVEPNTEIEPPQSHKVGHFRSGSALIQYRGYYVATTRIHRDCNGRVYRPSITILSPTLEPIYISETLDFQGKLFIKPFWDFETLDAIPEGGYHTRIITSLTLTPSHNNRDWIAEFNVNDQKNILVVLKNFEMFLDSVIYNHQGDVPDLIQEKELESATLCRTSYCSYE